MHLSYAKSLELSFNGGGVVDAPSPAVDDEPVDLLIAVFFAFELLRISYAVVCRRALILFLFAISVSAKACSTNIRSYSMSPRMKSLRLGNRI